MGLCPLKCLWNIVDNYYWSFVYIRKTYIGQSPKPQKVQIWKMRAFSVKCVHFMQIRWKCTHFMQIRWKCAHFMQIRWKCVHFQENACILCKLGENARILCKLDENAGKCVHFQQKTLPSRVTFIESIGGSRGAPPAAPP